MTGTKRSGVHVLDDGFQHWGLGRQVDVVLLTEEDLGDELLPAGNLREPLEALRFADVIVLREEELEATAGFVVKLRSGPKAPQLWVIRRRLSFVDESAANGGRQRRGMRALRRTRCGWRHRRGRWRSAGLRRPAGFVEMLVRKGVMVVDTVVFADHHAYDDGDVSRLVDAAKSARANGFLTTEKDAVKLTQAMRTKLEDVGPMIVAKLELELVDEKAAIDRMITKVQSMERRKKG